MMFGHLDKQRVICDVITGEARSVAIFLSPRFLTFVASDGFLVSVNGILFDGITDDTEPTPLRNERVENRCAVVNRNIQERSILRIFGGGTERKSRRLSTCKKHDTAKVVLPKRIVYFLGRKQP